MIAVETVQSRLWEALKDVEDPELPISIVDLGLVVDVQMHERCVEVTITLTSMGCPAIDMITDDIQERLNREPDVDLVQVKVVWDPIWTKDRLSSDGRMALREWGISV